MTAVGKLATAIDVNVVQERGEPRFLVRLRHSAHTTKLTERAVPGTVSGTRFAGRVPLCRSASLHGLRRACDVLTRVELARIRDREPSQKRRRFAVVVLDVDANERDAGPVFGSHPLERRELEYAGRAPGGPLVDHDWIAAGAAHESGKGTRPTADQTVGLGMQSRERRWRPTEFSLNYRPTDACAVDDRAAPAGDNGDGTQRDLS